MASRLQCISSEVLKFYELVPVTAVARVEHNTGFSVVAAHPELHLVSVAHENGVSLVNTANGKVLSHLPLEKTQGVCFNPADQSLIVSCESGLWRWPSSPLLCQPGSCSAWGRHSRLVRRRSRQG